MSAASARLPAVERALKKASANRGAGELEARQPEVRIIYRVVKKKRPAS
jgi:hypothetical protein